MKIAALALLSSLVIALPMEDWVPGLPRMNNDMPFDFKMFSGYVDITDTTKKIHYLFLESQSDPVDDPLIVWYNGGPGCSSMLGFIQEHGPFLLHDGATTFTPNDHSWNKEANILYIEQPAGVGYSWGDCESKPEQCFYDDNNMASENAVSLLNWYKKFPEYKTNDLYISGESYAGIYVPYTVNAIHHHNAIHSRDPNQFKPNLKGMMVGNGCTNWEYDTDVAYHEMAYWHSLYPGSVWQKMLDLECNYSGGEWGDSLSKGCQDLSDIFYEAVGEVNIYNVEGTCWKPDPSESKKGLTSIKGELKSYNKYATALDLTPWAFRNVKNLKEIPPCVYGQPIIDYLNNKATKAALHVDGAYEKTWDLCNSDPNWNYTPLRIGSQWVWEGLKGQYRMLKFSGNTDGAVPTTGTRNWIDSMNPTILEHQRSWFIPGQSTAAGVITEYDGLTFATVHGAGHMAPQFKPPQTYHLIFNWLKHKAI